MSTENRYAKDWNSYSKSWESEFGAQYKHLGDEWNEDGTAQRARDNYYYLAYADRWIGPESTVLEVGPGGGKWTVRMAPKVKRVIALDVAEEMLKRTRARCDAAGLSNVEYILGNGRDFQPVADASIDFFFSFAVFVHIALEDTWAYAQEMARVLKGGGIGVCHHAVNSTSEGWDRIEQNNEWYRGGKHTLGQFYYHSPESLRRMYDHCGLRVVELHQAGWHCTCVFAKPPQSSIPALEGLLRRLASPEADDDVVRHGIIEQLQQLPEELQKKLTDLLHEAKTEKNFFKRIHFAAKIRHLWRG